MTEASGFLNIHKMSGMTSHDVVAKIRRELHIKKVGHAGTLDPLATGVLVVCVGKATRLSEYVMQSTKQYRARIRLGITTDTYDGEGVVLQQRDASHITQERVEAILPQFVGSIDQLPPMYSAIKKDGRKLYDLARAGEVVEREPRRVTIMSLGLEDWMFPEFTLDVTCSAGTYIRSLAYDLGEILGVGAHLSGLTRLQSGQFMLENAITLDDLFSAAHWEDLLVSPAKAMANWPMIILSHDELRDIVHGKSISGIDQTDAMACAYSPEGELIAILHAYNGLWRPHKVFSN